MRLASEDCLLDRSIVICFVVSSVLADECFPLKLLRSEMHVNEF